MSIFLDAPASVNLSDGIMERDARLLVVGTYPAKNLTVTEADLDALVTNFSGPVPVKVEHIDSPLDPLGVVERVWRVGSELFGRVKFPNSMGTFLSERGAAKLSVGLLKEPVWKLLEASLTLTPHVPSATLLSDGERSELVHLRQAVRRQTVDAQIVELKLSGRVIPATEALARVLLSSEESAVVTLSDGGAAVSVPQAFYQFLKSQPPLIRLSELAGVVKNGTLLSGGASGAAGSTMMGMDDEEDMEPMSEDEQEMCRRMGVKPEDVRKTMKADRMAKGKQSPEQKVVAGRMI
jgi:hypothetical protein